MELKLYGSTPMSIFAINGLNENSATFALGWTIAKSQSLAKLLSKHYKLKIDPGNSILELQKYGKEGITDIEIASPLSHIIMEAKAGWVLPDRKQLERYAKRLKKAQNKEQ